MTAFISGIKAKGKRMERPENGRESVQGPTPPTSPASPGLDPKQGLVDVKIEAPVGSLASTVVHRLDVSGAKPSSPRQIKNTTDDAESQEGAKRAIVGGEQRLPGDASPSPSAISPDSRTEREGLGNAKFNSNDTTRYE